MRLYKIVFNNALPYEDNYSFTKLMVAKDLEEINENSKRSLEVYFGVDSRDENAFFEIEEIKDVQGYEVKLVKIK